MASLATIALFYAVTKWNSYLWPMIAVTDDAKLPLQVVIKKIIVDLQGTAEELRNDVLYEEISNEGIVYSSIVVSALPMLIIYPFVQKYFVKGVMIGAVKG